ncbi:MAG TPA: hypothetical protein VMB22_06165 [Verrucomicrobiae bacterium]|nr:hypothetical protein [Verrucomicrobiae bacterium]
MKTSLSLKSILAAVGVGSLIIYVLACATSFSPDDQQVLYPSFDPQSGAAAVALYDRRTVHSEVIFSSAEAAAVTNQQPALLRAAWLPDGKHILIASASDSGLDLFVLPYGVSGPVRHFTVAENDQAPAALELPFAIHGTQLFLNGDKRDPLRINLVTGETAGGDETTNEINVLPSPDGQTLAAFRDLPGDAGSEYGTFDPQTMEFKSVGTIGTNVSDGTLPTFNPADGRLLFADGTGDQLQLEILKDGKVDFTRPLAHNGDKLEVGPFLDLAPDGQTVLTAYCVTPETATNSEYGLLEIPLSDAPLKFTPLFHAADNQDAGLLFAQPSLSHDGKTWAIGTACLYLQDKSLTPQDCALFLVDLTQPDRPVTKIPIVVPAERKTLIN